MDITITPTCLNGTVRAIPSKSQAHRLLILAAFADRETQILCPETNRDMDATAQCLCALGADIQKMDSGYRVRPVTALSEAASLPCQDSGSTLRFLLPVVGALGIEATFHMTGRLPLRPLSPLWEEMERMGCKLSRPTADTILCTGKLRSGDYYVDGGISSQFLTGLLLAFCLMDGESRLHILGALQSAPYVTMTQRACALFGKNTDAFTVTGGGLRSPGRVNVEGDWSNAAFFLAAKALGSSVTVENLDPASSQGDQACVSLLPELISGQLVISAADIPDLVPILAVTAAASHGATFTDIQRLRLKESDRVAAVIDMITALGGRAMADESSLTVYGTGLLGGTVDSRNDHRIAMSAAIAATVCKKNVRILGAECVEKSYPKFFEEYTHLGGSYV